MDYFSGIDFVTREIIVLVSVAVVVQDCRLARGLQGRIVEGITDKIIKIVRIGEIEVLGHFLLATEVLVRIAKSSFDKMAEVTTVSVVVEIDNVMYGSVLVVSDVETS